jgi:hypothetical protein
MTATQAHTLCGSGEALRMDANNERDLTIEKFTP